MFILELKIASHGLLSIGASLALLMGSLMLIDSPDPAMQVSLSVILSVVGTTLGFVLLALFLVIKARRTRPTTGDEGMIGLVGTAREGFESNGMVYVSGEYWKAETSLPVRTGDKVEVTGKHGMTLTVKPVS
jgi:membrane-bound serine protease (ClpP class)